MIRAQSLINLTIFMLFSLIVVQNYYLFMVYRDSLNIKMFNHSDDKITEFARSTNDASSEER